LVAWFFALYVAGSQSRAFHAHRSCKPEPAILQVFAFVHLQFSTGSQDELALLRSIYSDLRSYVSFFQPVLKLIGKEQLDGKTVKKYDQAATPYRRVLATEQLPCQTKAHLN